MSVVEPRGVRDFEIIRCGWFVDFFDAPVAGLECLDADRTHVAQTGEVVGAIASQIGKQGTYNKKNTTTVVRNENFDNAQGIACGRDCHCGVLRLKMNS